MKTVTTHVKGTVEVWAIPTTNWERKQQEEQGKEPEFFKFQVLQGKPYYNGAVKVKEYDVTLTVPAGIDLLARAVATLEEERTRVLGEAQKRATEIQEEINKLLLLSGPSTGVVEGELLPPEEDPVF